jgi:hypothetical protein
MPLPRLTLFPLLLLLALAAPAAARDDPGTPGASDVPPQGFEQFVYKGLVGNALDAIPMDPSKRLDLQRTNAVVGNTLMGRSLAVFVGLSNPVLLLGGFVWGVWAAANIKPANAGANPGADSIQSGADAVAPARLAALVDLSAAAEDPPPAASGTGPILLSSISTGVSDAADPSRPHVIRIWPTQRSPLSPQ